jgi:hypothetical protein
LKNVLELPSLLAYREVVHKVLHPVTVMPGTTPNVVPIDLFVNLVMLAKLVHLLNKQ